MAISRKEALLKMYRKELLHRDAFSRFAEVERNHKLQKLLNELAAEEVKHAGTFRDAAGGNPAPYANMDLQLLLLSRKMLGLGLTVKIMEREERQLERSMEGSLSKLPRIDERKEDALKAEILGYNKVLSNIRDIFFGMSDGLVEILAAVSGIGAALQTPLLVIVAGLIVAVSGTLSMAGGAYLSTDYENIVGESRMRGYKTSSPSRSAAYVGFAYIFGAFFPLLPFIFGMSGLTAIAVSILVTAVVLAITSTLLSIVSDTSILGRLAKTLLITLGIAAITITLGLFARYFLHVTL
ncbi:MAG: VIT1/CCC1 transporter family protein [Candidatus Micrarchaeota archaeon]|nr:VIT1/CCC1 transporter family protein [Candidatus Micrarchaeota archaeon]